MSFKIYKLLTIILLKLSGNYRETIEFYSTITWAMSGFFEQYKESLPLNPEL